MDVHGFFGSDLLRLVSSASCQNCLTSFSPDMPPKRTKMKRLGIKSFLFDTRILINLFLNFLYLKVLRRVLRGQRMTHVAAFLLLTRE